MTAGEFVRWMAYYQLDPWDEERADFRAATIACLIANVNRGSRKKPFKELDFMPYIDKTLKQKFEADELSKQIKSALGVVK